MKLMLEEMTDEQLESHLSVIMEKLIRIRSQIDFAKAEAATSNVYKDPMWFNKTKYALRMTGREHQLVQYELAKRNKMRRREINNSVERRFVEIARRRLQLEVWNEIMEEAKDCDMEV